MTRKRQPRTGKRTAKSLKLKKETLRDLDVKGAAGQLKGGARRGLSNTC